MRKVLYIMPNKWKYEDYWSKYDCLDDTLKDYTKFIGQDGRLFPYCIRLADICPEKVRSSRLFPSTIPFFTWRMETSYWLEGPDIVKFFRPMLKVNEHLLYIKFLKMFENGTRHTYLDVYNMFLQPRGKKFGNDKDTFIGLADRCMIEEDGKIGHNKAYKITDFGREILRIASVNNRVHRVLRHYMKFKGDDVYVDLVSSALTNEDFTPDNDIDIVCKMLDELLVPGSDVQTIGSHYHWCNQLLKCLKTSEAFLELMQDKEVSEHIEEMGKKIPGFVKLKMAIDAVSRKRTGLRKMENQDELDN